MYVLSLFFSMRIILIIPLARLLVVPHFSSGIVSSVRENHPTREKATRLFSRGVIFKRARVSLALLSLSKNAGLLVV